MHTLCLSPSPVALKPLPNPRRNIYPFPRLSSQNLNHHFPLSSCLTKLYPCTTCPRSYGDRRLEIPWGSHARFRANAQNGGGEMDDEESEKLRRGESTMPERFRYLTKEAPDTPVRWPWFVGESSVI